jgi:hypothetical protein
MLLELTAQLGIFQSLSLAATSGVVNNRGALLPKASLK